MSLTPFHFFPISVLQLSLAAVLNCGQSFRWSAIPLDSEALPTHEYRLCLRDRVVCLRQTPDKLYYRTVYLDPQPTQAQLSTRDKETLAWLRDYFQLDVDLTNLYDEWATKDSHFANLQHRFNGIRILRQDPWECLVSFICSSNNNIPRIIKMVNSLCKEFSPPLLLLEASSQDEKQWYYPFPPPSALVAPEVAATLRSLGFGYRAEFIQKTAKMLVDAHGTTSKSDDPREPGESWLESLRNICTEEARQELLRFVGVGRKVADCVLLMSLDKKEVVPIDTHIYQLAVKYYGLKGSAKGKVTMSPKIYDDVSAKLTNMWGEYAGWAHSVIFTSDLRSFSTYGLPAPTDETAEATINPSVKRTRSRNSLTQVLPAHDLIDTFKKRRRVQRVKA